MIQRMLLLMALLLLSACGSQGSIAEGTSQNSSSESVLSTGTYLEDFGPAPELTGSTWLNTDTQLVAADLRGKVVLIDFWTFG